MIKTTNLKTGKFEKIFNKIKNCFKIRIAIKDSNSIAAYNTYCSNLDEPKWTWQSFLLYYQKDV
jgi:hypothetical protein